MLRLRFHPSMNSSQRTVQKIINLCRGDCTAVDPNIGHLGIARAKLHVAFLASSIEIRLAVELTFLEQDWKTGRRAKPVASRFTGSARTMYRYKSPVNPKRTWILRKQKRSNCKWPGTLRSRGENMTPRCHRTSKRSCPS